VTPFLKHIAQTLVKQFNTDFKNVIVVLPSQRASLFLKKHLSDEIKKVFLPPSIITINEFIEEQTDFIFARQAELLMVLYRAYCNIEKDEAESFEKFTKWGSIMLSDFNEIDRYMVDEKKILSDLSNIKEIENWSFDTDAELTDLQKNYLKFWNRLLLYYNEFNRLLDEEKSGYQGKVYKKVAGDIHLLHKNLKDKKIIFAGFSALSVSEEKILYGLKQAGIAELFFDADSYYSRNKDHEAGFFMRKIKNSLNDFKWEGDNYKNIKKKIKIYSAPGNVRMAALAGNILGELNEHADRKETALVLADEQLLLPVLNSLPENTGPVNVTMGLPLRQAEYFSLVLLLLDIQQTIGEQKTKSSVYHKPLVAFFEHKLISSFSNNSFSFIREIITKNKTFVNLKDIIFPWENENWKKIFTPWINIPEDALIGISLLNDIFHEKLENVKNDFLLEQVYLFTILVNDLRRLTEKYPFINELKTLRTFIRQYVNNEKVSFYGEPLDGLQLMGVLETRTLDFSKIIMLSVNENKIPKSSFDNTFIPADVKRLYGLPGKEEKDAVFAYHFYRLLQRANEVHLIYNDNPEVTGGGEKSRFILQLEKELPLYNNEHSIEIVPSVSVFENKPAVEKRITRDEVLQNALKNYFEKGVSPSALNTWLNCQLDFYYKYVIRLKEEDEVLESADHSMAGKIIHSTLEKLYTPFIGKNITEKEVELFSQAVAKKLHESFDEIFGNNEGLTGKNRLIYEAALKYLHSFFTGEKELISNKGPIHLIALETSLSREMEIKSLGIKIQFRGIADRIDKINNEIRIIDYKTGRFEPKELTPFAVDEVFESGDYGKALQLMMYSWMYSSVETNQNVQSYIVPLRLLGKGYFGLSINKRDTFSSVHYDAFEKLLEKLITEIYLSENEIHHNHESDYCKFCRNT